MALAALVAGTVAYLLCHAYYADVPSPPRYGPISLLLLALAEFYVASMTRARLAGRSGTKPVEPLVVARTVVLAKSTSPVAALAVGGYAGFLVYVARVDSPQAARDTTTAAVGVGCAVALLVAALVLEWVCRVPEQKDDDD
jgi:hypothetical protein